MNPVLTAALVYACLFGAAMLGMQLRPSVPGHHLSDDSRKVLEICLGIIGTMSGLVLGLLVASATTAYNTQRNEVFEVSSKVILLDQELAHYGPDSNEARRLLKETAERALYRVWPETPGQLQLAPTSGADVIFDQVELLTPRNEDQRMIKGEAVGLMTSLMQTRWLMYEQADTGIQLPLLIMLVFWFTITFIGFGLFAPRNVTTVTALALCSLAVSGAIFLILELYSPFQGLVQISSDPLRHAIAHLGG